MRRFKPLSICIVSLSLLLSSAPSANLCGYFLDPDESYFSAFDALLYQKSMRSFKLSVHAFGSYMGYGEAGEAGVSPVDENLEDWGRYFGEGADQEAIEDFVYRLSRAEAYAFKEAVDNGDRSLAEELIASNPVAERAFEKRDKGLASYMVLAVKCAEVARIGLPGEEEASALVQEAERGYARTQSAFLKARYAFQMTRLAHYSYQNQQAVDLYERYGKPLEGEAEASRLLYWALSQKSGAAYALSRSAESESDARDARLAANYGFARVYAEAPSLRLAAYRGLFFADEQDFRALLAECRNDEERALVWFLTSLDYDRVSMEPFEKVMALAPKSVWLEHLLAREINKLEGERLDEERFDEAPTVGSDENLSRLVDLARKAERAAAEGRKGFWRFALAYLSYLDGNMGQAEAWLEKAKPAFKAEAERAKVEGFALLLRMGMAERVDEAFEAEALPVLKRLYALEAPSGEARYWQDKNESVFALVCGKLAARYRQQGQTALAEVCLGAYSGALGYPSYYNLYGRPNRAEKADALRALFEREGKSAYLEFLLGTFRVSVEEVVELQGTSRLAEGKLEEAVELFEQLPSDMEEMYSDYVQEEGGFHIGAAAPFEGYLNDWTYYNASGDMPQENYTKLRLAREMLAMKREAETAKGQQAAEAYFKLANASYNITYFGHAFGALDYVRPSFINPEDAGNNDFYDCSRAEALYLKAKGLSEDEEFQARCLFMAAKCEQNRFYLDAYEDRWDFDYFEKVDMKLSEYRTHFATLKEGYAETEFYRMTIDECGYLEYYDSLD